MTVAEAVEPLAELVGGDELVYVGGPVQQEAIVVLGEFEEPERAASLVLGAVGFLPGEIETARIVGPLSRVRVFAGYAVGGRASSRASWPRQSWIVEPAVPDDVFADDPEALWSEVLRRKGGPYAVLSLMPPDPSLN